MCEEEIIKQWIDEICLQIPSFFSSEEMIKDNLDNFVIFNYMEWWNIALIYYQRKNASFIRSKENWEKIINKTFFIKKGEKGIKILLPLLNDDEIKWKIETVWDIEQAQDKIMVEHISDLKILVDDIFKAQTFEKIKKEELMQFIIKKNHELIESSFVYDDHTIAFIKNCIEYVLINYLPYDFKHENKFVLNQINSDESVQLYALLKTIIGNMHLDIKEYYDMASAREKKQRKIEEAEKIMKLTIHERIDVAHQLLNRKTSEINEEDDESSYYDQKPPTGNEREVSKNGIV